MVCDICRRQAGTRDICDECLRIIDELFPGISIVKENEFTGFARVYTVKEKENADIKKLFHIYFYDSQSHIPELLPDSREDADKNAEKIAGEYAKEYGEIYIKELADRMEILKDLYGKSHIITHGKIFVCEDGAGKSCIFTLTDKLCPLPQYLCEHSRMSKEQSIRLGIDICKALDEIHNMGYVHTEIATDRIYINDRSEFLLGVFDSISLPGKRNCSFMGNKRGYTPPEIITKGCFDKRADIYSLGFILYKLMNENRPPFISSDKMMLNPSERQNALGRLYAREKLPSPCNAGPVLSRIILKACAFDPDDRYQDAREMLSELEELLLNGESEETEDNCTDTKETVDKPRESSEIGRNKKQPKRSFFSFFRKHR